MSQIAGTLRTALGFGLVELEKMERAIMSRSRDLTCHFAYIPMLLIGRRMPWKISRSILLVLETHTNTGKLELNGNSQILISYLINKKASLFWRSHLTGGSNVACTRENVMVLRHSNSQ
jgi:hypothetical protein